MSNFATDSNVASVERDFSLVCTNSHKNTDDGIVYYDFASTVTSEHTLTISSTELPTFLDRAYGHLPPYDWGFRNAGPTEHHYQEVIDENYRG